MKSMVVVMLTGAEDDRHDFDCIFLCEGAVEIITTTDFIHVPIKWNSRW